MIRQPATLLILGPRDLDDYDIRRKYRGLENIQQQLSQFEVGAGGGLKFKRPGRSQQTLPKQSFNTSARLSDDKPEDLDSLNSSPFDQNLAADGFSERPYLMFAGPDSSEDSHIASPENVSYISVEIQPPSSSPPRDGFHHGDFISTPHRFTPFAPEDISTPQNLIPAGSQGYRARTLPRSPLYFSHNASSSPERRPTSSLTPRVASHVANHNTPGIIFASPARRPATFKHQTNSFSFESFDSTERSSAAYVQDRISSLSTTDTTPRPSQDLRLRDELHGSSLASSRGSGLIFSSPRLPPPFSTTSRNVSNAESLPASLARSPDNHSNGVNDYEMPVISPSRSPDSTRSSRTNDYEMVAQSLDPPNRSTELRNYEMPARRSSRSPDINPARVRSIRMNNYSPANPAIRLSDHMRSGAARIVSYYRPRSPSTPLRHLPIYNDALPPHTQPQTPSQLPEARHQSRYHPAYTAPITRGSSRPNISTTPSRRSRGGASPLGLQNAGFRGLYGGRENGDEEQSWIDGVRFSNAEVRLWGLRDSAGDGPMLRDTPEREAWRVGRH